MLSIFIQKLEIQIFIQKLEIQILCAHKSHFLMPDHMTATCIHPSRLKTAVQMYICTYISVVAHFGFPLHAISDSMFMIFMMTWGIFVVKWILVLCRERLQMLLLVLMD